MKKVRVRSFTELHNALTRCRENSLWIFRGQSNAAWKLIPRGGRPPFDSIEDDALFSSWRSDAVQYLTERPRTELEWLALAQHHGLATRLLDWSRNPLVAAFFAVWEDSPTDAALYAFMTPEQMCRDYSESPFIQCEKRKKNVFIWGPDAIFSRVTRQQGVFTVHEPATTPLYVLREFEELICIRIDKSYRSTLREELAHYGITRASLFPDLDGLASYHNWRIHYDFRNA
jgi:hypothetical protein